MRKRRIPAAVARCGASSSGTISASKKSLRAAEQERIDVEPRTATRMRDQRMFDLARLVFIDETSTNTAMVRLRGRCPRGIRLIDHVPHGHWKTITFIAGLRPAHDHVLHAGLTNECNILHGGSKHVSSPTLKRRRHSQMVASRFIRLPVCERRLKRPVRDYVTSPNIRRTSIRLSRRSANLKRICESQPSVLFRVSRAGSVPSWPHSVRKNVPITSDMQATLLHDRNPL